LAQALAPVPEPPEFSQRRAMPQKSIPKEYWHFASMIP
jgi:hypothetical protein